MFASFPSVLPQRRKECCASLHHRSSLSGSLSAPVQSLVAYCSCTCPGHRENHPCVSVPVCSGSPTAPPCYTEACDLSEGLLRPVSDARLEPPGIESRAFRGFRDISSYTSSASGKYCVRGVFLVWSLVCDLRLSDRPNGLLQNRQMYVSALM